MMFVCHKSCTLLHMTNMTIHKDIIRNIGVTQTRSGSRCEAVGTGEYNLSKTSLWEKAGHPLKLAPHCIDLDDFQTDNHLAKDNPIIEFHRFGGIQQTYKGKILSVKEHDHWEMGTHPTSLSRYVFGLPHKVRYEFSEGKLQIKCTYILKGVLSLPIIRNMVMRNMEKAISKLLTTPAYS